MSLREYLPIQDHHRAHFEDVYRRYKELYEHPESCRPMIIVNAPSGVPAPCMEEQLADPIVMLKASLDALRPTLEIGDDKAPLVGINFGTAQIPAAFGCELYIPPNNTPAASTHVADTLEAVRALKKPALNAGWLAKLDEWIGIWKENLPNGVHIQHMDIQSPFNNAHLIRGNDILTDFYDQPEVVDRVLEVTTDFMIDVARHNKAMISNDREWFFDWQAMWKGAIRISNCSMHMISPEFYKTHILKHDKRFLEAVGGGRIHYCGTAPDVIQDFFTIPTLSGLDVEFWRHDFHALAPRMPKRVSLITTGNIWRDSDFMKRLLAGDWPEKRNIILQVSAKSVEDGKRILEQLRNAMPY